MSISQKIDLCYKNSIKSIKKMKNGYEKDYAIGSLIADLGKNSINAVSNAINICWRKAKKCYLLFLSGIKQMKLEFRGRKSIYSIFPSIRFDIEEVIDKYSKTDSHFKNELLYIDITIKNLRLELINTFTSYTEDNCPSETTIWRILKQMGYKKSKVERTKIYKKVLETDAIFENVNESMSFALKSDDTIATISIDDKAKKIIGNISDKGLSWIKRIALDHDTKYDYSVTPFGILDLKTNETFVTCTLEKSTAEFKVDVIEEYLLYKMKKTKIKTLIIFLDNGPENSGKRKLWLKKLVELSIKYNIKIELVYYPPYHSKYNKIERVWARLQMSWSGIVIDNLPLLIKIMNKVTWNGIKMVAKLSLKKYETGINTAKEEINSLEKYHICRDEKLPKWSIVIHP